MTKRCTILFCFLFIGLFSTSQKTRQYTFAHYSTANGLAANHASFIRQDAKGFIWISTINGLQRFDGNRFITFHSDPLNKKSIPSDHIPALFIDKKKRMWITGTNNKVGIFNTNDFTFQEVPVTYKETYSNYRYKYFIETHDGKLLLYEIRGSIYRYDEERRQFVTDDTTLRLPKGWAPVNIIWDSLKKSYWISSDSGLLLYNPATRMASYRGHNVANDPVIKQYEQLRMIHAVRTDNKNNIFFFQWLPQQSFSLIHNYNRYTGQATVHHLKDARQLGYYELYGILQQRNGRKWIYGMPVFAEWLPDHPLSTSLLPINALIDGLRITFQTVSAAYEDRDGNIWLATDNGVYQFNPNVQLFQSHNLPIVNKQEVSNASIHAMLQTKEGNIFISTYEAGLFYFTKEWQPLPLPLPLKTLQGHAPVWDIHQHTKSGKIWFTLQRGEKALFVFDPKTGKTEWITDPVFNKRTVRQIAEDKQGNLWFGLQGGHLIKWSYTPNDAPAHKNYSLILDAKNHITTLFTDNQGILWVATAGSGLLKLDTRNNTLLKRFGSNAPKTMQLLSNTITGIIAYDDTTLVAVGGNLELIHPITDQVRHVTTVDGLPSNTVISIQKDRNNILWLGMKTGICRVNLRTKAYTLYDRKDGLPYDNFSQLGAFQLSNGQLLFATPKNFVVFSPSTISEMAPQPPVITAFWLGTQSLRVDSLLQAENVNLTYNNSSITLSFSNLTFQKNRKIRYYYKLEGLEKTWKKSDETNQVTYNYIPPGKYTFLVKSENEDGVFSPSVTAMKIEVTPPFWETSLFYAMLGLLVIGFWYLIDNERLKRIRSIHQIREQLVIDLHKDINTTLTDINLLSEMAKIKADKDQALSKDYIQRISTKSWTMKETMNEMLWSIDPQNDSMEKLLLKIQEYTEGFKSTHPVDVQIVTNPSIRHLKLSMRSRHDLFQIYKTALCTTAQALHSSSIRVFFDYTNPRLQIKLLAACSDDAKQENALHDLEGELQKKAGALRVDIDIEKGLQQKVIRLQLQMA